MTTPTLFPFFMEAGTGTGGNVLVDDIIAVLAADPDIVLEPDIVVELNEDGIDVTVDPDIEIEVD